jgi:uncharacterized protein (DUF2141 family)
LLAGLATLAVGMPALADTCIPVEVQNLRPEKGTLMVAAYASAEDFQKKPLSALQTRAGAATMNVSLCLPGAGPAVKTVALTLYQDLNDNGKLDANLLGIPSEPWGASGKPPGFGAPTWDTAQVPLDGKAIVVKLSK